MDPLPPPLAFFLLLFSGWVNRHQEAVIAYLLEENRVLRAAHGPRRLRLADDQRRRLAVKGKVLGRRVSWRASSAPSRRTRSGVGIERSWRRNTMARTRDALVVRAPSQTSPRWWSAWQWRTRPGATRAFAVVSRVSATTLPATRSKRSTRITAS